MRLIRAILAVYLLLMVGGWGKGVSKGVKLSNFKKQGPFMFLMKFYIDAGEAQMDVRYTKGDEIVSQGFYNDVSIAMINQTLYPQFAAASTCQQKSKYIYKREKFHFRQEKHGIKHVKIFQLNSRQQWYFYLYSCYKNLDQLDHSHEQINIVFSVLNNGSHFGVNQQILYAYIVSIVVWILLIIKFAIPIGTLLSINSPEILKIAIFGGLVFLGAAYFYRLIHLALYNSDGMGIYLFEVFYIVLKNLGEAIITTALISVSWGWSIIHTNSNQNYIIIGAGAGLVNIISLILSSLTEEHQELYHHFQTIPGVIVLVLRFVIFFVFAVGITSCLKRSSGKVIFFIRKFGLIGGLYLLCWPLTVLVVQCTFPNYMHKEVITFIDEVVHLFASTVLCNMISEPESAYRRVSLNEDDNPLGIKNYHMK